MSIETMGPGALDYLPCRYGASKLVFRGPRRDLTDPFVAFVGSTETYGKFIENPYPSLVETALGRTCVNFGLLNAGIDAFVHDPFVIETTAQAEVTVVQVMGAQNMTNRFYAVHPRRNDRFVSASNLLKTIYREVDFAEFNFNKHMLSDLLKLSPDRFYTVKMELQVAWLARMRLMLSGIKGKTILLWFASEPPPEDSTDNETSLGNDPLFITRQMIDEVTPLVTKVVQVNASAAADEAGTQGMVFSELEALAAQEMLGPLAHEEAASALVDAITVLQAT
jgi:hypothetical protein